MSKRNCTIVKSLVITSLLVLSVGMIGCGKKSDNDSAVKETAENQIVESVVEEVPQEEATAAADKSGSKIKEIIKSNSSDDEDGFVGLDDSDTQVSKVIKNGSQNGDSKPTRKNTVEVSDAYEFLSAIASDTEIVLAAGTYNLTEDFQFADLDEYEKWEMDHENVHVNYAPDGNEVFISDISKLSIVAAPDSIVRIVTEPRYADVLNFEGCANIYMSGITVGHTPDKGSCDGAVLEFNSCSNIELRGMDLFGCGTFGLSLYDVDKLNMTNSIIRECSYGILEGYENNNLVFRNCEMRDCEGYTMLDMSSTYAKFDTCLFEGNYGSWGMNPTKPAGNNFEFVNCTFGLWESEQYSYGEYDVDGQKFTDCDFYESNDGFPYTDDDGTVHVNTVEQLLSAIEPNASIELEPGYYNISDYILMMRSVDEWNAQHPYVEIVEVFDGHEVDIKNADGLSICSATGSKDDVEIVTSTRYAAIMNFTDSDNVILADMTMGHSVQSECAGNVVDFYNCANPYLTGMDLYGCGVCGIGAYDVSGLEVNSTRIHDCSDGPVFLTGMTGSNKFTDCVMEDSNSWGFIDEVARPISFTRCVFGREEAYGFRDMDGTEVNLVECTMMDEVRRN